ncbi:Hexuronic acid methyltransferase AglP [Thermoplasmatales archaeon]|nr:Hexuronic acid methyltransferase AglP [Thermoplasmatales archaeon]
MMNQLKYQDLKSSDLILSKMMSNQYGSFVPKNHIANKLVWKYRYLQDIKAIRGNSTFLGLILSHLLRKENRLLNYKDWKKSWDYLPKEYVKRNFGIEFTDETPGKDIVEVFIDKIYSSFQGFAPTENDVILDVGAQFGDYALLCSNYAGSKEVISLEPLKDNFNILLKNLRINAAKNVDAYNYAASSSNGKTKLHISGNMGAKIGGGKIEEVSTVTLDSFYDKGPTLMKIDVEGFELDVLNGAKQILKDFRPRIILETHSRVLKNASIKFLSDFAYSVDFEGRKVFVDQPGMDYVQNVYFSAK